MFVFFNDTATTEIYTYSHTRSLHDALPISVAGVTPKIYARLKPWLCVLPVAEPVRLNVNTLAPAQAPLLAMLLPGELGLADARAVLAARPRSEEHTSELQSLMRIPYAVFCL